jgi:hypothetical protein
MEQTYYTKCMNTRPNSISIPPLAQLYVGPEDQKFGWKRNIRTDTIVTVIPHIFEGRPSHGI